MIVHRFMCEEEYRKLISGLRLHNNTRHSDKGKKSNAVGFCFFTEDPDEAIHWLSGCTFPDKCVTMEIPDHMLKTAVAIYRDTKLDKLMEPPPPGGRPTIQKIEYCLTDYNIRLVKILAVTNRYAKYANVRRALIAIGMLPPF